MKSVKEYQVYVNIEGSTSRLRKFTDKMDAVDYLESLKSELDITMNHPLKFGNSYCWQISKSLFKNLVFVEYEKIIEC